MAIAGRRHGGASPAALPAIPLVLSASAERLCAATCENLDLEFEEAWDALCCVPANMLCLLESPQGWSALADYIAAYLGTPAASYAPTVH